MQKSIKYQQLLSDYLTNKISSEEMLEEALASAELETGFIYKKAAYITVPVSEIVCEFFKNGLRAEDLPEIFHVKEKENEILTVPLFFSANEFEAAVLSLDDIAFDESLSKLLQDTAKSVFEYCGREITVNLKGYFATVKELKNSICSLKFGNRSKAEAGSRCVLAAKSYIEQNFQRKLSLDEVAGHLGITSFYFCRLFKKETGVNFNVYLNEVRLVCAKRLLTETRLNNKEICKKVGINSTNYFHQLFKSYTGMTPAQFRKSK